MAKQWETVHIFISSTFNDMHAERDYLVKQVFPQLREWCEKRKLRLVDIDLRWGVTEQDAHNQSVVKVCLDRIDDCRPFFLCFLGQRRGWVPKKEEISASTFETFPTLQDKDIAGIASVTEMEILHALVKPLHQGRLRDPQKTGESYEPAKYAFFYLRDGSYLGQLPAEPALLRQTYTNDGIKDENERKEQNVQLKRWREQEIPATQRPVRPYQAHWNEDLSTPELSLPLKCPSGEEKGILRWQEQWKNAGLTVTGLDVEEDPNQAKEALERNKKLITGRLSGFQVENQPLSQVILADLQAAITSRYPDHTEVIGETDLQKELDQQEQFLFAGSQGFIKRGGDFDELDSYIKGDSDQLFVLTAPGGMGKSSLLANWVDRTLTQSEDHPGQSVHFRFIGQSDRSTTVYSLLHLLLLELKEVAGKLPDEIPDDPQKLRQELPKLLEAAGKNGQTIIVLDALNQLESGLSDLAWLPFRLPANIKLIVSFKRGEEKAETLLERMQGQVILSEVKPFQSLKHRLRLVQAYLSQYLKELDKKHWKALIQLPGAENPLYLKVVLSELRVFGAFINLGEKIRSDFGETPVSAFNAVLNRLENDPAYSSIDPGEAVPLLFGLLAHAKHGLSVKELSEIFVQVLHKERQAATDTIHLYLRQVRPFLAHRDGRYDFFFESFRSAAVERYSFKPAGSVHGARTTTEWHSHLADYFQGSPLWETGPAPTPNLRKVMELPYHLASAGHAPELIKTLTSFEFLQAKLTAQSPASLIEDFALKCAGISSKEQACLDQLRSLFQQCAHALRADPGQLPGQLLGRLSGELPSEIQDLLNQARSWRKGLWLRPKQPSLQGAHAAFVKSLVGHTGQVMSAVLSADGRTAVSGSLDGKLIVWDVDRAQERFVLEGHGKWITSLSLFPGDNRLLSMDNKGGVRLWDLESRKELAILRPGSGYGGGQVYFEQDGQTAVLVADASISRVSLPSGNPIASRGFSGFAKEVAVVPERGFAIFHRDKEWFRWDFNQDEVSSLQSGVELINALTASPDGRLIAEAGFGVMRIRDASNGTILSTFPTKRRMAELEVNVLIKILCFYDEHVLVAGCDDKTVRLYDINTGQELQVFEGHAGQVTALGASPQAGLVLSGSEDYGIRIWKVDVSPRFKVLQGHTAGVTCTSWLPGGEGLISGSVDGKLIVWDVLGCRQNFTFDPQNGSILATAVSGDGRFVAAAGEKGIVWVWDLREKILVHSLKGHTARVNCLAILPNEEILLSGSEDGTIRVWDLQSGAEKLVYREHTKGVTALAVSTNGEVVSASKDTLIHIWNPHSGEWLQGFSAKGFPLALLLLPENRLAVASEYLGVRIFDLQSGEELMGLMHGDAQGMSLSPDGKRLFTGGKEGMICIWDMEQSVTFKGMKTASELEPLRAHAKAVTELAHSPDGRLLASASLDGTLLLWDLERKPKKVQGHTQKVNDLAVSQQNGWAVSASDDFRLKIWSLDTGEELATLPGHSEELLEARAVAVGIDGQTIVSGTATYGMQRANILMKVWRWPDGSLQASIKGPSQEASRIVCLPDGRRVITRGNGALHIWDLRSGTCLHTLSGPANLMEVSRDGRIALAADMGLIQGEGNLIKVWDLDKGREIASLAGPQKHIKSVALLGDGRRAVSASSDGKLLLWDLHSQKNTTLLEEKTELLELAVFPDGNRLLTSDITGQVWVVDTVKMESRLLIRLPGGGVNRMAIFAQGKLAALSGRDQVLRVLDLSSGQVQASLSMDAHMTGLAVVETRVVIAAADNLGRVHILELAGYKPAVTAVPVAAPKAPAVREVFPGPVPKPRPAPPSAGKKKPARKLVLKEALLAVRLGSTVRKGRQAMREQTAKIEKELDHYDVQALINMLRQTIQNNKSTQAKYRSTIGTLPEFQQMVEGNQELEIFVNLLQDKIRRRA